MVDTAIVRASVSYDYDEGHVSRLFTKLNTIWVLVTYPFAGTHSKLRLHYTSEISRCDAKRISLGDRVEIGKHTCLFAYFEGIHALKLVLEEDCRIGPRCIISSRNSIHLERGVVLESDALIMDHAHAYEDISKPIILQGMTSGGQIRIGDGCLIGRGAVILCGENRQLTLGKHCVVAPRAVVTRSFPVGSIISGNPATAIRNVATAQIRDGSRIDATYAENFQHDHISR